MWEAEYVCAPWPSLVPLPEDCTDQEERQERKRCAAICARGRGLLLKALRLRGVGGKGFDAWLTGKRWEQLVGLVTQNAAGISQTSLLRTHLEVLLHAVTEAARHGKVPALFQCSRIMTERFELEPFPFSGQPPPSPPLLEARDWWDGGGRDGATHTDHLPQGTHPPDPGIGNG